jgi:hypothetical protein
MTLGLTITGWKLPIPIRMVLQIEPAKAPIFLHSYLLRVYFKNSIKLTTMIAEIPMTTIQTQIGDPSSFFSSISLLLSPHENAYFQI